MTTTLHHPAGTLADNDLTVALTPAIAGWAHSGLLVVSLRPGVERSIGLGDSEAVILPLSATDVDVTVDDAQFHLDGRISVFDRVTDFAYAPLGATVVLRADTVYLASEAGDPVLIRVDSFVKLPVNRFLGQHIRCFHRAGWKGNGRD